MERFKHIARNSILLIILFVILVIPKINLITISGARNGIRLDDIVILLYLIYFFARMIKGKIVLNSWSKKIISLFFIYVGFSLVSSAVGVKLGAVQPVMAILYSLRKLEYFALFLVGIDYGSETGSNKKLLRFLNYITAFHIIYALLEYAGFTPELGGLVGRPLGLDRIYTTFSGAYELSAFMSIMGAVYLTYVIKDRRYIYIIPFLACTLVILISQSRIPVLALAGVALIEVIYYSKHRMASLGVIAMAAVLFVGLVQFSDITALKRFRVIDFSSAGNTMRLAWENGTFEKYLEADHYVAASAELAASSPDASFMYRISKWALLTRTMLERSPVFGLGPSVVGEGMDGNFTRILCENGFVGIILWMIILVTCFRMCRKNHTDCGPYIYFALFSLAIVAIFIDVFEASKTMSFMWFLLGVVCVAPKNKHNIKVAQVVAGINHGGVETMLENYYSNMDSENIESIIISHNSVSEPEINKFKSIGFTKIYGVTPKQKSLSRNFLELCKIFRREKPDIVHVHMNETSFCALAAGFFTGVPVRICHIHLALPTKSTKTKTMILLSKTFANQYFACSKDAGEYMYGKKRVDNGKVRYINNVIDTSKFSFDKTVRTKIRKQLGIKSNEILLGNIGRLETQKNQIRLINIMSELPNNYRLLIIGDGSLETTLRQAIKKEKLNKRVDIISTTDDVAKYYSAFDKFVFPSNYEGLGMVVLEAQTNGLPTVISDVVPDDVNVSDLITRLSLDDTNKKWADSIKEASVKDRADYSTILNGSGYSATDMSNYLYNIYSELLWGQI